MMMMRRRRRRKRKRFLFQEVHSQDEELGLRNYDVRTFRPQGDDDGDEEEEKEEVHSQNEQVSLRMMCNYDVRL